MRDLLIQLPQIIASLKRNKTPVILVILEIALSFAILSNLISIVGASIGRSNTQTGVVEDELGVIQSIYMVGSPGKSSLETDVRALRATPGVVDAAFGSPPLWNVDKEPVFLSPERSARIADVYEFSGSQDLSRTLGVVIVEGRPIEFDELPDLNSINDKTVYPVLITEALARRLFPGGSSVGEFIYDGTSSMRIVGVVKRLLGEVAGRPEDEYSILAEYRVSNQSMGGLFLIRGDAKNLGKILLAASRSLAKVDPDHVETSVMTFQDVRDRYFRNAHSVAGMLVAIIVILLFITAAGLVGLVHYWVRRRHHQIGIRRALGATRRHVLVYFLGETLLVCGCGVVAGAALAFAFNVVLIERFGVNRLPLTYIWISAFTLLSIGVLSALGAAFRASAISPLEACRLR